MGDGASRASSPAVAVLVLLSSVPLFMMANKNFMPHDDQSEFEINLRAPEGTSLESTEVMTNRVANAVRERLPEVDYTLVTIAGDPAQTRNLGNIYVRLKPIEQRTRDQFAIMDVIRKRDPAAVRRPTCARRCRRSRSSAAAARRTPAIQFVINGPDLKKLEVARPAAGREGEAACPASSTSTPR